MTYEPLQQMVTTGSARLDHDGCMIDSGEYVAALYESYAADHEAARTRMGRHATPEIAYAMDGYAHAAQVLAEELYARDVEDVTGQQEASSPMWTDFSQSEYDRWFRGE